jgi:PAS domain S-box
MPVRRRLLLLVFSLLIPATIACGVAVLFAYSHERARSEEYLLRTTQALAEAVDRDLDTIVRKLEVLATSPSLAHGDLPGFWQRASKAVTDEGMWVVLTRRDGQQLVNTLRPFGTPLPHHSQQENVDRVFQTARPVISPVFTGPVSGQPTLAIDVPVIGPDGQVAYSLAMGILPSALRTLVTSHSLPDTWLAAVFDTNFGTVARSRDVDRFLGKAPSPVLLDAMKVSDAGVTDAVSLEGIPTRVAYGRSPMSGWRYAVGVPKTELVASIYQTLLLFSATALVLLAVGTVLALRIGRTLSTAITTLVPAAENLGKGEPVALSPTGVQEVDQVAAALIHAGETLQTVEAGRRRADDAERTAREKAEEILSSITDGFYALDRDWRFSYINTQAQAILGKGPGDVLGKPFLDIFPQVRGSIVHQNYEQVMTLRQPRQFDFISPILKRWTTFSVYPSGEGGIAVYFRDISARKAAEEALVAAKEEAERANRAKSQFLAAASHDLRQPVQSLFFFHDVLARKLAGHPSAPVVANMQNGLNALKSLLDGLLDISRLHAGAIVVDAHPFPIAILLDQLAAECADHAAAQGVTLRVVNSSAWVRSDAAQLERMLRNLLDNAIKYTGRGGRVLLGCRRTGGNRLRLEVVDTGPGVPEDKHDAIFEEFVQLGNPERDRNKGLGLGLAIVRHLGRLLDHPVAVRSRPGRGTAFSVTVPLTSAGPAPRPILARVAEPPSSGGLVLVVDDEALVLYGLQEMLENLGWRVLAASSGDEAVQLVSAANRTPDVIVADYRLRGNETGVKVIHQVCGARAANVPAVVLTGDTGPERIAECRRSGFRLLHKPVDAQALHATLTALRAQISA